MDESFSEILYNSTSFYLAFVAVVGVVLNSKALWKIAEVIKVKKLHLWLDISLIIFKQYQNNKKT